jgi:hypothetical protein
MLFELPSTSGFLDRVLLDSLLAANIPASRPHMDARQTPNQFGSLPHLPGKDIYYVFIGAIG